MDPNVCVKIDDRSAESLLVVGIMVDNGSYGDKSVLKKVSMVSKGMRTMVKNSAAHEKHRAEYKFYLAYVRGRISLNLNMTKEELVDILLNTCASTGYFIPCDNLMGGRPGNFSINCLDFYIARVGENRITDHTTFDLQVENILDFFGYK